LPGSDLAGLTSAIIELVSGVACWLRYAHPVERRSEAITATPDSLREGSDLERAPTRSRSGAPCNCLRSETRSIRGVVRAEVGVKLWTAGTPSVDEVRPARCPGCTAASRPQGQGIVVQGHGTRERQLWGPSGPGAAPELVIVVVRRFRCIRCRAVTTVGPAELLTRRLYSAAAIAYALALFAISGLCSRRVRSLVSPLRIVGPTSAARWLTLSRWCSAIREARMFRSVRPAPESWSVRQIAERAATTLASYALPSPEPPSPVELAFHGAARAP
jgi:hypothetical protein